MCGRTTLVASAASVAHWLGLDVPEWVPRYNVCPTEALLVVRLGADSEPEALCMKWGLVPYWTADPRIGAQCINARAETIATKPAFRDAFRLRRCLIVVDGWYEWATRGRRKQPVAIRMPDDSPFAFAGLWEQWCPPQGDEPLLTCTIATTVASPATAHLHHRMPVVLVPSQFGAWLDPATPAADLREMLAPYGGPLRLFPVSPVINTGDVDDARCLEPVVAAVDSTAARPESDDQVSLWP